MSDQATLANPVISSGFTASFSFGERTKLILSGDYQRLGIMVGSEGGYLPIEEAIPQLERVLETAKYLYYGSNVE